MFVIDKTVIPNANTWFKTLRILDLHRADRCVWSYNPCDELNPVDPSFIDFDDFKFEVYADGSIILLFRVFDLLIGQRDVGR